MKKRERRSTIFEGPRCYIHCHLTLGAQQLATGGSAINGIAMGASAAVTAISPAGLVSY